LLIRLVYIRLLPIVYLMAVDRAKKKKIRRSYQFIIRFDQDLPIFKPLVKVIKKKYKMTLTDNLIMFRYGTVVGNISRGVDMG
jgi:hypothetical protein